MNAWGVLKQAVKDAPAGATIKINGTIKAATASGNNGELEITKNLSIEAKSGTATLDANNMSRIFKVTGGKFQLWNNMVLQNGNAGENEGGGIYVSGGELVLSETTIKNCIAQDGDGIYLTGNGTKGSMYNTKILNNKAQKIGETTKGGGICIADSASFEMDGGTTLDSKIDGNVSTGGTQASYGGGVCVIGNGDNGGTHASFIFKRGTISNNTARYGGGVMVEDGGTFTMEGRGESYKDYDNNIIQGNTADASGGGVAVHGAMTMNGGQSKIIRLKKEAAEYFCGTVSRGKLLLL